MKQTDNLSMRKLLFIAILSGCSAPHRQNVQNRQTEKQSASLNNQNREKQSIQQGVIAPAPVLNDPIQTAEKAVWEIQNELTIPINKISLVSEKDQNKLYFKMDVENRFRQVNLGAGTGFFISPTHIVTNFHVIQNSFNENISTVSKKKINGEFVFNKLKFLKISSIYDLALLESVKPVESYLKIENSVQYPQTKHFLITYTKDNSLIKTPIHYFKSLFDELILLFERDSSLGNLKGASGGAVVNPMGNIVGVNHGGSKNLSAVISIQALNDFLTENHRDCSQLSQSDCLSEEWAYLDELSQKKDKLAQYLLSTGFNHSQWLEKKQALMTLIENKNRLKEKETKFIEAVDNFNKSQKEEARIKLKNIIEEYQLALNNYNQSVSAFNTSQMNSFNSSFALKY